MILCYNFLNVDSYPGFPEIKIPVAFIETPGNDTFSGKLKL
jgi:hypothetical protein